MYKNLALIVILITLSVSIHAEVTYYDIIKNSQNNDLTNEPVSLSNESITSCNQNFNNVNVSGNIVMSCITNIEQSSKEEREAIKSISYKLINISSNIENLQRYSNTNNKILQKNIRDNKIVLSRLNQEYLVHKKIILINRSIINNLKKSSIVKFKKITKRFTELEEFNHETELLLDELGISITQNSNSIVILEGRVDIIENDLSFLMDEYTDGNLKSISFYGPKLGATQLNDNVYSSIGFEFERLLDPKYNMSLFVDISRYSGEKESKYTTLNGLSEQIVKENNTFYGLGIGARKFFKKINDYNIYAGTSIGYTQGDEKTYYASAFGGIELYKKYNKLSLEIGYQYFDEILHRQVVFNPLGQSTSTETKEDESGISLTLKYSTR